jgi:hypothetical protein
VAILPLARLLETHAAEVAPIVQQRYASIGETADIGARKLLFEYTSGSRFRAMRQLLRDQADFQRRF